MKLYEHARIKVVSACAVEVPEHREKTDTITQEVEDKDLKLQAIPGLAKKSTLLQNEEAKLWNNVSENRANVADIIGIWKKFLAVKEGIAELLLAVRNSRSLRVYAEENACSAKTELIVRQWVLH